MSSIRLEQRMFSRGKQSFELKDDDDYIRVSTSRRGNASEYRVPLEIISPDPNRLKRLDIQSLVGAIVFTLGTAALLIPVFVYKEWGFLIICGLVALPAVGFLYQCRARSVNASVYYARNNGQSVLVVWNANPSQTVVDEFCAELTQRARRLDNKMRFKQSLSPADELRKLGELRKDGVLTEEEFVQAKAKVLEGMENRSIGFKP